MMQAMDAKELLGSSCQIGQRRHVHAVGIAVNLLFFLLEEWKKGGRAG
jgi:hypothetical protein